MSTSFITSVNSNTTLETGFDTYLADASSGSITLTLPTIIGDYLTFTIKRTDSNASNNITIVGESSETIDSLSSIILNPKTIVKCVSLNGSWHTTNGNSKGNEITLTFSQIVGTSTSRSYILVNNAVYTSLGIFKYKGSQYYGNNPIKFEITYSVDSDTSVATNFSIQLQDVTNANILSTIGPLARSGSNTTFLTDSTLTFSNIPATECIIEIDGKINSGASIRLHSITLILN